MTMIGERDNKCINPWLGLLVIVLVCIIVVSAVFFGNKHPKRRQDRGKAVPGGGASKVGFEYPAADAVGHRDDRLVF